MFSPFLKKIVCLLLAGSSSLQVGYSLVVGATLLIVVVSRLQSLGSRCAGSVAVAHGLSCLQHVESSRTGDRNGVPCIGRRILYH